LEKLQNCGSKAKAVQLHKGETSKVLTLLGYRPSLGFDGCSDQWIGAAFTKKVYKDIKTTYMLQKSGKESQGIYAVSTWLQFWRQNQT